MNDIGMYGIAMQTLKDVAGREGLEVGLNYTSEPMNWAKSKVGAMD